MNYITDYVNDKKINNEIIFINELKETLYIKNYEYELYILKSQYLMNNTFCHNCYNPNIYEKVYTIKIYYSNDNCKIIDCKNCIINNEKGKIYIDIDNLKPKLCNGKCPNKIIYGIYVLCEKCIIKSKNDFKYFMDNI